MPAYDWKGLLTQWSREILGAPDFRAFLEYEAALYYPGSYTAEVLASGWLGYPGASAAAVTAAEARLGRALPPDYRAFLQVTNGWRWIETFIPRLWPVQELRWLRESDPELIEIWSAYPQLIEAQYIAGTLPISDQELAGTAMYLLNPQAQTSAGEWEAWFMAHWVPGAIRYPSFWALMQAQHAGFLQLQQRAG